MMLEPDHPNLEQIALWLLDPASDELDASARLHLERGCPRCSELATALRRLAGEAREAQTMAAPRDVMARARALVSRAAGDATLTAELLHDTVELVGVRGEAAGARHLLFQAGDYDLSVRIRPEATRGRSELRLQLHAPVDASPAGVRVRVIRDRRVLGESVTDELGEATLTRCSSPPYHLELVRGPLTIRTPRIK